MLNQMWLFGQWYIIVIFNLLQKDRNKFHNNLFLKPKYFPITSANFLINYFAALLRDKQQKQGEIRLNYDLWDGLDLVFLK